MEEESNTNIKIAWEKLKMIKDCIRSAAQRIGLQASSQSLSQKQFMAGVKTAFNMAMKELEATGKIGVDDLFSGLNPGSSISEKEILNLMDSYTKQILGEITPNDFGDLLE